MCGIYAISNCHAAGNAVLDGLKKLEYRGYDSWGIAVRTGDSAVSITKGVGKISAVKSTLPDGAVAIGHTRWATHGGVSKKNAHPHRVGRVTLVHNGIVENFDALKKKVSVQYRLKTQTDSEVAAALIDSFLTGNTKPEAALEKAAREIEGRFAFVVLFDGDPRIYALRHGSPLILGRTKESVYVASDIPAFLAYTRSVNYLNDGEMAVIDEARVTFKDLNGGKTIKKRATTVPWQDEEAEKGTWPHFMLKEIFEQRTTIAGAVKREANDITAFVSELRTAKNVYLVASGTAHKVAMAGEYLFATIADYKVRAVLAEEMPSFERFVDKHTALVAISQSGETADVLEILEHGKKRGARIFSIVNVESSTMARISHQCLTLGAGPEKAVASTKAMTAQMALLMVCAHALRNGKSAMKKNVETGRRALLRAAKSISDALTKNYAAHIGSVAHKIAGRNNLFILGRRALYPVALEAAIKIQEVSYIHAHGF
ncbi:MAG: glutamine--fructose-6-phosphate transaminase (isomerizing), partial [bacterium]|nr:glutamine--fructose-6-phosphate transaminase (isomerizing) [bacterium]